MLGFALPKGVFRYTLMPQILPRIRDLMAGGLGYIPFFLAHVYSLVGLLPSGHPYLESHNIGRFGLRHVVAEAANNLNFSFKNLDQIFLFLVVLVGLILFFLQFLGLVAFMFMQPVGALPNNWAGFFVVPAALREHDIAHMMLDMVFGVPYPGGTAPTPGSAVGFFESCISSTTFCRDTFGIPIFGINIFSTSLPVLIAPLFSPMAPGANLFFPFPYHDAMHRLFAIYSTGLLVVAVIITSYFVATVVAETAQSGIPFGRRFNKTWAPLRIVIAFGLLVPLTVGLNSSQYVVLYAAKYGSAFATNGWRYFNDTLAERFLASGGQDLVSIPNVPELKRMVHFMYVAQACKYAYEYLDLLALRQRELAAGNPAPATLPANREIRAYALTRHSRSFNAQEITPVTLYQLIVNGVFLPIGTSYYTIRFGVQDPERFENERAHVRPICGEIQMVLTDSRPFLPFAVGGLLGALTSEPGPGQIQEAYFNLVRDMWHPGLTISGGFWTGLGTILPHGPGVNHRFRALVNRKIEGLPDSGAEVDPLHSVDVDPDFAQQAIDRAHSIMRTEVADAVAAQIASARWDSPSGGSAGNASPLYDKGWAGAGIWYNRIAELNGGVVSAAYASPIVTRFPLQMEKVVEIKKMYNESVSLRSRFTPEVAGVDDITSLMNEGYDSTLAQVLADAYEEWDVSAGDPRSAEPTGNPFLTAVSSVFGLNGLLNMRDNTDTHPLALLSGIGRSLVEGAIKSLGITLLMTTTGLVFDGLVGQVAGVAARFFVTVAMVGLTIGFVLFYVVPFLPFLYFFFAVGGWIKGIFEAMLGAPLWALAHIRIDGNGLPGNAALNGYFLIFEVFLRPILIVFGLLASISTYSALVNVLNSVFDLVVENTGGFDLDSELAAPRGVLEYMRSLIDEFFFTVIYAIVVYMLGMSSFKLIDTIPNNILRWMGQSVATFNDQREDVAQALVSKASIGSQQVISRIGGGLSSAVGAATRQ